MPLAFVHGVNARKGGTAEEKAAFDRRIDARDELFRTISLAGMVAQPSLLPPPSQPLSSPLLPPPPPSPSRSGADEKLIVVAHSMGGNIVYDILSHFDPSIKIDALITVGSQVALFKELRLYAEDKSPKVDAGVARKPDCVGTWLNVFDPLDVLGFAASGVFKGVHDFAFSTQASALDAHSTYFLRPTFHERLRERLVEVGIGVPM